MGAITRIRQISPLFLAVVAVLFIVFMVIQDSSCSTMRSSQQGAANTVVGTVNGTKITLAEYELRVRAMTERQKQANPNAEVDDEALRQQVWDELVNEIIRKQEADKLGIVITDQEITDVMLINPPDYLQQGFRDSTGRFMRDQYLQLMTDPESLGNILRSQKMPEEEVERQVALFKKQLIDVEDDIRKFKLDEALRTAVGATASIVSPTYAEQNYQTDNSSADIKVVALDAMRIPDAEAKVSDDEAKAYYEQNKEFYEQKRGRKIKYMAFPIIASGKDTAAAIERSKKLMEIFTTLPTIEAKDSAFTAEMVRLNGTTKDFTSVSELDPNLNTALMSLQEREVFGPLSTPDGTKYMRLDGRREGASPVVRASHILINLDGGKDSAKAAAEKIMARAKKGEDFATLARENSKDPGSAMNGGDLGFFAKGRMVKPFEDAAFGAAVGSVVGPIETQFGYHIIKVTDKQSTELKYSEITIKPTISTATKQRIMADASRAEKTIQAGTPIDDMGKQLKVKVVETPVFQETTPILGSRAITQFAFDNDKGSVLRQETKGYGMIVAQVTDTREPGIKPFEDVREEIIRKLTVRKKIDMLKNKAEQIASSLQSAGNVDGANTIDPTLEARVLTQVRNNGQLQGIGTEYAVTQAAYTQSIGSVGKPVRGERGWYIVQVTNRAAADMGRFASEKTAVVQNLATRTRGTAYYAWFNKVRENSEIKDERNKRN